MVGGETPLVQATSDKTPLVWATRGGATPVWPKVGGRLSMAWHLLHDLQVAGANHSSHLRHQMWALPATTRGL